MKVIFRGYTVFEYNENNKEVTMCKIHGEMPAFDYCDFIPEDYKLLSEFFDKAYKHTQGEKVELIDIDI